MMIGLVQKRWAPGVMRSMQSVLVLSLRILVRWKSNLNVAVFDECWEPQRLLGSRSDRCGMKLYVLSSLALFPMVGRGG